METIYNPDWNFLLKISVNSFDYKLIETCIIYLNLKMNACGDESLTQLSKKIFWKKLRENLMLKLYSDMQYSQLTDKYIVLKICKEFWKNKLKSEIKKNIYRQSSLHYGNDFNSCQICHLLFIK